MKIICNAKAEMASGVRNKKYHYYEAHHILPKSLFPLWKRRKSNLVLLPPREHYFCHELLTKIYPGTKMAYTLWMLSNSKTEERYITGREYEKAALLKRSVDNPNKNNKYSSDVRQIISS